MVHLLLSVLWKHFPPSLPPSSLPSFLLSLIPFILPTALIGQLIINKNLLGTMFQVLWQARKMQRYIKKTTV